MKDEHKQIGKQIRDMMDGMTAQEKLTLLGYVAAWVAATEDELDMVGLPGGFVCGDTALVRIMAVPFGHESFKEFMPTDGM